MDYRDDRPALLDRLAEAEQSLAEANARADRSETELAAARAALNEREAELRRLRGSPAAVARPAPARRSGTVVVVLLSTAAILGGFTAFLIARRSAAPRFEVEPTEQRPVGFGATPATLTAEAQDPVPAKDAAEQAKDPPGEGWLQWGFGSGRSVFPTRIDGDDVEDVIGTYKLLGDGMPLFVGGFDGKTFDRIWAAGPYGKLAEGVSTTHVAVVGDRVFVTDYRSKGHVLDAKTGKELLTATLTDTARSLCPVTGRKAIWVEVRDEKNVEVDLTSGDSKPAERPTTCGDKLHCHCCSAMGVCEEGGAAAPGLRATATFGGVNGVTTAVKAPGTPTLMAYAAGGKGWSVSIAPDPAAASTDDRMGADFGGGLLVAGYELQGGQEYHLTALEAATGARKWDIRIPKKDRSTLHPNSITASETRVYVPHWTWLDVYELQTGKLLGRIGH